jgi:hypothetical protein
MANLDDIPTQSEYTAFRSQVLGMVNPEKGKPIWNSGQFNKYVGPTVSGRTWGEINEDTRIGLQGAPKQEDTAGYEMDGAELDGQWRGFQEGDAGTLSDTGYRDMVINRIASGFGGDAGKVEFSLVVVGEDVGQDFFTSLGMQGELLETANATYADQKWTWTGSSINLVGTVAVTINE